MILHASNRGFQIVRADKYLKRRNNECGPLRVKDSMTKLVVLNLCQFCGVCFNGTNIAVLDGELAVQRRHVFQLLWVLNSSIMWSVVNCC
jgi:hypothetical protein